MLKTIDAHVAGQSVRFVVEGFPAPSGSDMGEKREWVSSHADALRRIAMLEPRGHRDLLGAVFTEPVTRDAHAGILFMDGDGFPKMSIHGIVAATVIAIQRQLLVRREEEAVVYDTPAGAVRACLIENDGRGGGVVRATCVPSFVLYPGASVTIGGRSILVDVAWGGRMYAVVDSEAAGVGMTRSHVPELRRMGVAILDALDPRIRVTHPADSRLDGLDGVVFTGPAAEGQADLQVAVVCAGGGLIRSPSGTGTCAVIAVLHAMGVLAVGDSLVTQSLIGSRLRVRIAEVVRVAETDAIVPELEAGAWVTGEHAFFAHDEDPLRAGFSL